MSNIRNVWKKEPHFSDWLVTDDGLTLLADELGVDIEDPVREPAQGEFKADIVGHEVGNDEHIILVENQFGKTNHDHLGKLLTYATATSAVTAIWIAEEISPDHQRVIDWLNDNTPAKIDFFLAKLEVYQIDNSNPAPHLDVVCRPNKMITTGSEEEKERHIWRRQYWTEVLEYIRLKNPPFRLQRPRTSATASITVGRNKFHLELMLTPKRECVGCQVVTTADWKESAFAQLEEQKSQIESELGYELEWSLVPGREYAYIRKEEPLNPRNETLKEQIIEWFAITSIAFYKVFAPRIKELKAPESSED